MSGGSFVFAINIVIGLSLLAGFTGAWIYDRRREDTFWWFIALLTALLSAAIDLSLTYFDGARIPRFLMFATHLAAMMFFARGIAAHYHKAFRWTPILIVYAAFLLLNIAIIDLPRQSLIRQVVYQAPYGLMVLLGAFIIFRSMRGALENLFFVSTLAFAAQYPLRPLISVLSGGIGASPASYLGTTYGLITQSVFAVTGISTATLMLVLVMRAIIIDLRQKGLHDPESGLLNRTGFEEEVSRISGQGSNGANHAAFALFAVDGLESLIEREGEGVVETTARAIGKLVRRHISRNEIPGRLGRNLFAVQFPKADTRVAAAWCEELRGILALDLPHVARGHRGITASFGVTRRRTGETFADLLKRAEEAVYHARQLGGDNVCVRDRQRYVVPSAE